MDDCNLADLPFEVRTKLAELEVELSEGDITEKGYQKKKAKLLAAYVSSQDRAPLTRSTAPPAGDVRIPTGAILLPGLTGFTRHRSGDNGNSRSQWSRNYSTDVSADDEDSVECGNEAAAARVGDSSNCSPVVVRQPNRHFLRDDLRYRSDGHGDPGDIREEAVKEALARNRQRQESLLPNKRRDTGRILSPTKIKRQAGSDDSDGNSEASSSALDRVQVGSNSQAVVGSNSQAVVGHETPVPLVMSGVTTTTSTTATSSSSSENRSQPVQTPSPSHDAASSPARHVQSARGNGDMAGRSNAFHSGSNCFDSFDRLAAQAAVQLSLVQSSSQSSGMPLTDVDDIASVGGSPSRGLENHHQNKQQQQQAQHQQVVGRTSIGAGHVVSTPSSLANTRILPTAGVKVLPQLSSSEIANRAVASIPENQEAQFHTPRPAANPNEHHQETNGGPSSSGLVCSNRVSEKIQQLVNTLKRPKRRPLPEYFLDEEDQVLVARLPDAASIPRPTGKPLEPLIGQQLVVPSGLPRSLESALQRYAGLIHTAPVLTCLDSSGRQSHVLTYGKLLESSVRIAYMLLNKLGHRGELSLKPRDRVALVYANNEPVSFLSAFYGCVLASVVPVAIEVPTARRDSVCQSMGFLLSAQDIRIVLTSEQCYKAMQANAHNNNRDEATHLSGWPRVTWINTDRLRKASRPPKNWVPPDRLDDKETMYIEYTYHKDGSIHGVMVSRQAALTHCRAITSACDYREEDVVVCVVDFRREAGMWHVVLNSVFNGFHVIYVPYSVMQSDPGSWLRIVTKYKTTVAIVKSRDMHWALLAERDHSNANLSSLRMLLVVDGSNPWSLNSCDAFVQKFRAHGFNPDVVCPCAGSSETLTLSLRRPPSASTPAVPTLSTSTMTSMTFANDSVSNSNGITTTTTAAVRGVISIVNLTYGVIRIDAKDSLTSLALQDCGTVLPGSSAVIVRLGAKPVLCRSDELGEICLSAAYTGSGYWGLLGQTGTHFQVEPVHEDGTPLASGAAGSPVTYTRSGFLGFVGPSHAGDLIFICGSVNGLLTVAGRQHNADDLIATVLAVEPTKIVYRGRIAIFSIDLLKDGRLVVVAELRQGFSDEAAFTWMSLVLQAVDSIHQVSLYSLALVPQNTLPRTPFGGINCHAVRRLFSEGQLHPTALLLCPHSAIQNLPQTRKPQPIQVGPSAIMVGQMVQGVRPAEARGRPLPALVPSAGSPESGFLHQILSWRADHAPNERLLTVYNQKGQESCSLTCSQLMRRAERLAHLLLDKAKASVGTVVALLYFPGVEVVCAFYACLLIGAIPVPIRPPHRLDSSAGGSSSGSASNHSNACHLSGPPGSGSLLSFGGAGGGMLSNSTASCSSSTGSDSCGNVYRSSATNFDACLELIWNVVRHSCASVVLTQQSLLKMLKSKEATSRIPFSNWPTVLDTEDSSNFRRKSSQQSISPCTDQPVAYLDFAASTTGTLSGIRVTHQVVQALCRAQKFQCELYPTREVLLSLDPYSGLGFSLWALTSVYCGHQTILVPSGVSEALPDLWLNICSQRKIRDAFCSPFTMSLAIRHVTKHMTPYKQQQQQQRDFSLSNLRSLVVVTEERPRVRLTSTFVKLFACFGLPSRAVSSSFGCRANMAISLQGGSSPESITVYVDQVSLRNDRIKLLEKGSPHSLCLVESGKLLPGVHVAIANPDTLGQCADSQLGEIWVSSTHNSTDLLGPFESASLTRAPGQASLPVPGSDLASTLNVHLVAGDVERSYARTGFLGFVRRTELTQSDGELHDAIFVVGSLTEAIMLRGMRFHPVDIENTVMRSHKKICECAVFTWSNLLVVVVELVGEEGEAMDLVHPITAQVLDEHQLIVGVVVVTDPGTVPVDPCGVKQRILLRDSFVSDKLDPIYVSYNM